MREEEKEIEKQLKEKSFIYYKKFQSDEKKCEAVDIVDAYEIIRRMYDKVEPYSDEAWKDVAKYYNKVMCSEDNPMVSLKDAKKVISQALQTQRAELLEKLPKEKKIHFDNFWKNKGQTEPDFGLIIDNKKASGFNDCLSEVKKIIEGDKEK